MTTPNFSYTTGNPDNLVGGNPAVMTDIQGPFYDLRAYLNAQIVTALNGLSPPASVLTGARVLDVGVVNQVRAGRQLTLADFTNLGLSAPAGLWNLSNLTDVSGNGRTLVNKGSVPFATGINGAASTAAQFSGNTGQALYIADTGAADPFRIKTGSLGMLVPDGEARDDASACLQVRQRSYGTVVSVLTSAGCRRTSGRSRNGTAPMGRHRRSRRQRRVLTTDGILGW